mmetsp:Transcript_1557/g.3278  ORF Transcript_1557/g.3278 Transcript_1557/m.3278 type:complete len:420 (+) Transcript_1557:1928-3187(+)
MTGGVLPTIARGWGAAIKGRSDDIELKNFVHKEEPPGHAEVILIAEAGEFLFTLYRLLVRGAGGRQTGRSEECSMVGQELLISVPYIYVVEIVAVAVRVEIGTVDNLTIHFVDVLYDVSLSSLVSNGNCGGLPLVDGHLEPSIELIGFLLEELEVGIQLGYVKVPERRWNGVVCHQLEPLLIVRGGGEDLVKGGGAREGPEVVGVVLEEPGEPRHPVDPVLAGHRSDPGEGGARLGDGRDHGGLLHVEAARGRVVDAPGAGRVAKVGDLGVQGGSGGSGREGIDRIFQKVFSGDQEHVLYVWYADCCIWPVERRRAIGKVPVENLVGLEDGAVVLHGMVIDLFLHILYVACNICEVADSNVDIVQSNLLKIQDRFQLPQHVVDLGVQPVPQSLDGLHDLLYELHHDLQVAGLSDGRQGP